MIEKYLPAPTEEEILNRLSTNNVDKNDLLITAIHDGYLEGIKIAIKHGASIHENDNLALRIASSMGDLDIIKYLVKNGASIHTEREAPLKNSIRNLNFTTTRYLIRHGADVQKAIKKTSLFEYQIETLKRVAYEEHKKFKSEIFRKIMSKK